MRLFFKAAAFLLMAAAAAAGGCLFKNEDVKTTVIRTPGMRDVKDAETIQKALSSLPGVKAVAPDVSRGEVRTTYDSMALALKNLEYAIAGAGFDANAVKAKPEAAAALRGAAPQ